MSPKRVPPAPRSAASAQSAAPDNDGMDQDTKPSLESIDEATAGSAQAAPDQPAPAPAPSATSLTRSSAPKPAAARGGAKPRVALPKFAGRRSQAARAELEKAEADRKAAEAAEAARRARREGRGRGGGRGGDRGRGRGRGGFIGDSTRQQQGEASGPFSLGQVSHDQKNKGSRSGYGGSGSGGGTFFGGPGASGGGSGGGGGGGGSGGGGGGGRSSRVGGGSYVKQEYGEFGMGGQMTTEDGGYISSDEDDDAKDIRRRNVDDLRDIGFDNHAPQFAPMRLRRQDHKERQLGINADSMATADKKNDTAADPAASEKRKGKQRAKDVEYTGEQQKYHGAYSSSETEGEPHIKAEPTEDDDESPAVIPQDPPSSPESRRKAKELIKTRTHSDHKPEKPAFQTKDEAEEWERVQRDFHMLRSELGTLVTPLDQDGDQTRGGAAAAEPTDQRADKVYLFQFPPVLPDLVSVQVKTDHAHDTMDVDGIQAADPVTVDDIPGHPRRPRLPSGSVGKLRVHKSGRATLDWGGTALNVGMGTEVSFLQDIMVATLPEAKEEGGTVEPEMGVGMSMGQVRGKFVVTPDWDEILG